MRTKTEKYEEMILKNREVTPTMPKKKNLKISNTCFKHEEMHKNTKGREENLTIDYFWTEKTNKMKDAGVKRETQIGSNVLLLIAKIKKEQDQLSNKTHFLPLCCFTAFISNCCVSVWCCFCKEN